MADRSFGNDTSCFNLIRSIGIIAAPLLAMLFAARSLAAGPVDVPYTAPTADPLGNHWVLQPWSISQSGEQPVFSDAANLLVDSTQPPFTAGQAHVSDDGEIIFDKMQGDRYTLARRVKISDDGSMVRVVDVVTSIDGSSPWIWYGSHLLAPLKSVERIQGSAGLEGCIVEDVQGRAAVEVWGENGAPLALMVNPQAGNNGITVDIGGSALPAPSGTPGVVVHLHATAASLVAARAMVATLNRDSILAGLPPEILASVLNFKPASADRVTLPNVLQGGSSDVLELNSGERLRGTLQEASLRIHSMVGNIDVPAADIEGCVANKDAPWSQNLLTRNNDLLCGRLTASSLHIKPLDGPVSEVPTVEISRIGIHEAVAAPGAASQPAAPAWIRSVGGDQIAIDPTIDPLEMQTRIGTIKIDASTIAEVEFASDAHGDDRITLTDGTLLSGFASAPAIKMQCAQLGCSIDVPIAALDLLHLHDRQPSPRDGARVELAGGDLLQGSLTGDIQLETSYDTVTLHANEMASLSPMASAPGSVVATLSDGVTVHGELASADAQCTTACGLTVRVPLLLISKYTQPNPSLTATLVDRVNQLVTQLSVDQWKDRQDAEAQLIAIGPEVAERLKKLRPDQMPEGQQRIDAILRKFGIAARADSLDRPQ